MTFKGKAKIAGIATIRVIILLPLSAIAFFLLLAQALKNDIIPDLLGVVGNDWNEIAFNVKKIFAKGE